VPPIFMPKFLLCTRPAACCFSKAKKTKSTSEKSSRKTKTVPGGMIKEEEYLAAAEQSGSASVQLQIAAREAAARQLYETTGLDVRQQAERFKPAVLTANPPMNAARGFQYLRNEKDNKLYYFLQVDDTDFDKLKEAQQAAANDSGTGSFTKMTTRPSEDPTDGSEPTTKLARPSEDPADDGSEPTTKLARPSLDAVDDGSEPTTKLARHLEDSANGAEPITKSTRPSEDPKDAKLTRPSEDPGEDPPELRLSNDYIGFEFVHDPMIASKVLKQDKNDASIALKMIMNAASEEIKVNDSDLSSQESKVKSEPDAKATVYNSKSILDDDENDDGTPTNNDGLVRTVGIPEDAKKEITKDVKDAAAATAVAGKLTYGKIENTFYNEEAKLNMKTSNDTAEDVVAVSCCCSFW